MNNESSSTPQYSNGIGAKRTSNGTEAIINSIANFPSRLDSNTPKLLRKEDTEIKPMHVDSSGLMFSIKKPKAMNLKERRRFVDKHHVANYNQYDGNEESSEAERSIDSALVNNKSGILIGNHYYPHAFLAIIQNLKK